MKPGDRQCALCRHVGPETEVGPGLVAVEQGSQVRYVDRIRCRDRDACRRRVELVRADQGVLA